MNGFLVAPSIIALGFIKPGDEITTCDSAAREVIRFCARRSA
jgi:hypothetical protein